MADAGGAQALFGSAIASNSDESFYGDVYRSSVSNTIGQSSDGSSISTGSDGSDGGDSIDSESIDVDEGFEALATAWLQHGWMCLNRWPHDHNAAAEEDTEGTAPRRNLLGNALAAGGPHLDWRARKAKREAKEQREKKLWQHDGPSTAKAPHEPLGASDLQPQSAQPSIISSSSNRGGQSGSHSSSSSSSSGVGKSKSESFKLDRDNAKSQRAHNGGSFGGLGGGSHNAAHKHPGSKWGRSSSGSRSSSSGGSGSGHAWQHGDLRCRRAEPLQPEAFLQDYLDAMLVQVLFRGCCDCYAKPLGFF